ncbi:hypothetical protein D3C73_1629550 [compost metagenome]
MDAVKSLAGSAHILVLPDGDIPDLLHASVILLHKGKILADDSVDFTRLQGALFGQLADF